MSVTKIPRDALPVTAKKLSREENLPLPVPGTDEAARETDDELLSQEELHTMLRGELEDARSFIDTDIGVEREAATADYKALPYGDEEQGRSRVVMTDVRDAVLQTLPSLMRIFAGTERAVEFRARRADGIEEADQRTDVVNYVIREQNPGFLILYAAFKDALVRKTGIIKWWWDERTETLTDVYEGLLDEQIMGLADDEDVVDIGAEKTGEIDLPESDDSLAPEEAPPAPDPSQPLPAPSMPAPQAAAPGAPRKVAIYKVTVHRERKAGQARFAVLPGEEFLIDSRATCLEDATVVAHQRYQTRSDLLAMGYTDEFLEEHEGSSFIFDTNAEYTSRRSNMGPRSRADHNPATGLTLYTEAFMRIAHDPRKPAVLTKICAIGDDYFIAKTEEADEIPFAPLSMDPEPHEFFGTSMRDLVADLQRINTKVMRSTLDSLALAIHPRMEVVEQNTNLEDALNTEIGALIRVRQPNSIREVTTTFVGDAGLRMLDWLKGTREERTGQNRASQGLDADLLQSTTKAAVTGALTAAQARTELIARLLAEGIKTLYSGLAGLLRKHQDVPMVARLRGKFVAVDPSNWSKDMDCTINVGLGQGLPEDRMTLLQGIKLTQETLLAQAPQNPICGYPEYRYTLGKMVELGGYADAAKFFKEIPSDWQPPQDSNKTPSPEETLAKAQSEQIQAQIQIEQAKLKQQEHEMYLKDARERDKMVLDAKVKIIEIEQLHKTSINEAQVTGAVEMHARASEAMADAMAKMHAAETQAAAQPAEGAAPA